MHNGKYQCDSDMWYNDNRTFLSFEKFQVFNLKPKTRGIDKSMERERGAREHYHSSMETIPKLLYKGWARELSIINNSCFDFMRKRKMSCKPFQNLHWSMTKPLLVIKAFIRFFSKCIKQNWHLSGAGPESTKKFGIKGEFVKSGLYRPSILYYTRLKIWALRKLSRKKDIGAKK